MADQEGPKIIVDTDWKSQAQAEKERLAAAEKPRPTSASSPSGPAGGAGVAPVSTSPAASSGSPPGPHDEQLPIASFEELIRMLATQALLYLGAFPDPESGRRMVSLELAQFNIDMLAMIEEKTAGNLAEEEKTFLTRMLYELRMQFAEITRAVAKAVEQGKIAPQGTTSAGGIVTPPPNLNIKPPTRP